MRHRFIFHRYEAQLPIERCASCLLERRRPSSKSSRVEYLIEGQWQSRAAPKCHNAHQVGMFDGARMEGSHEDDLALENRQDATRSNGVVVDCGIPDRAIRSGDVEEPRRDRRLPLEEQALRTRDDDEGDGGWSHEVVWKLDPHSRWSGQTFPLILVGRTQGGRTVERRGRFTWHEAIDLARRFAFEHGKGQYTDIYQDQTPPKLLFRVNVLGEKTFSLPAVPDVPKEPTEAEAEILSSEPVRLALEVFPGASVVSVRRVGK